MSAGLAFLIGFVAGGVVVPLAGCLLARALRGKVAGFW